MRNDNGIKPSERFFDKLTNKVTKATGSPLASVLAFLMILIWGLSGPIFHFSDTWQLVINTSTTIITFLMVFIIQQSQNKDTIAIHLKLNELIASSKHASNQLVDIEDLTESELETVKKFYMKLADKAESESSLSETHSLSELESKASKEPFPKK
jgi:low affinity Fe/Cu permease